MKRVFQSLFPGDHIFVWVAPFLQEARRQELCPGSPPSVARPRGEAADSLHPRRGPRHWLPCAEPTTSIPRAGLHPPDLRSSVVTPAHLLGFS